MTDAVVSHWFDAPVEAVYRAFTDPTQVARWYGPDGMSVDPESVEIDARSGGSWTVTMVSDRDPSMRMTSAIALVEVVENQLIIGTEQMHGHPAMPEGAVVTLTVELTPENDGTRVELRQGPFPEAGAAGSASGWRQAMAKLASTLRD